MNELQVFDSPEFGKLRTVEIDNAPWFVAADVCKALEISDTWNALQRLDDDEKGTCSISTLGGEQKMNIVNEPGLYTLVLGSRKPEAKAFKRWITHEVIPAIRKQGGYLTPAAADQLAALVQARADMALSVQSLIQRVDAIEQKGRRTPLQALSSGDNPFEDCVPPIKPPSNKIRRQWMRVASEKLDLLADKCGLPSSTVLHNLYHELEVDHGISLSEVRLRAIEEHQLTDCSILLAIFYDKPLRVWFEKRVEGYLSQTNQVW